MMTSAAPMTTQITALTPFLDTETAQHQGGVRGATSAPRVCRTADGCRAGHNRPGPKASAWNPAIRTNRPLGGAGRITSQLVNVCGRMAIRTARSNSSLP
ncbi:hypothetical protein GCM10023191_028410 [Actinoallomurus oryzae]|uniref:Uncharacterized protein n=1 Tax=Actinoallomurus oryzae TaxID=502180 RepID=A0ABP8PWA8_9ACTN